MRDTNVTFFDLDGVLCDYVGNLEGFCHKNFVIMRGVKLNRESYDAFKDVGLTEAAIAGMMDAHYDSAALLLAAPFDVRWVDVVNRMNREGQAVAFLTARPVHKYPELDWLTRRWVKSVGVMNNVPVLFSGDDKAGWLLNRERRHSVGSTVLIDDNLHTVLEVNGKAKRTEAMLVPRPYNVRPHFIDGKPITVKEPIEAIPQYEQFTEHVRATHSRLQEASLHR